MAQLADKAKGFVADKVAKIPKPEAELENMSVGHVGRDGATLAGRIDVPLLRKQAKDPDQKYHLLFEPVLM